MDQERDRGRALALVAIGKEAIRTQCRAWDKLSIFEDLLDVLVGQEARMR